MGDEGMSVDKVEADQVSDRVKLTESGVELNQRSWVPPHDSCCSPSFFSEIPCNITKTSVYRIKAATGFPKLLARVVPKALMDWNQWQYGVIGKPALPVEATPSLSRDDLCIRH